MDDYLERSLRVFGPDDFAVAFFLGLFGIMIISTIGFFYLSWSWITSISCVFAGFVIWRHITIVRDRPDSSRGRRWITKSHPFVPDISTLPASYFLFILGSGGHTTEMIEMIRRSFRPNPNQHRRYLVSTADTDSLDRITKLEAQFLRCFDRDTTGTLDAFAVPRARAVHQPLWSAPLTCLLAAVAALNALTREPNARSRARHGAQFKYPHVVVTNGPATGFVVCLVAHALKVLYLVPHQSRLKLVYVESWARSRSLSLTGRLFLWTGVADLFCVQHEELARVVGKGVTCVGLVGAPPPPGG